MWLLRGGTVELMTATIKPILKREPDLNILHVETTNTTSVTRWDILNLNWFN